MSRSSQQRGFTLLEMMISAAISLVVLGAVAAAFVAANSSYQTEAFVSEAVEGNRVASTYLQRVVGMAGYGVPPQLAFDFTTTGLPSSLKDNYSPGGVPPASFTTDDLAFRYRDPGFLRRGSLSGSTLTFDAVTMTSPTTLTLPAGQPMMVICYGDASSYGVVTLNSAVTLDATSKSVAIANYGGSFPSSLPSCLNSPAPNDAFIMLMYDVRIRVVAIGGRPYLVAFHNLNAPTPGTNNDYDPLVADVEDFQVAYVMNRPLPTSTCCSGTAPVDATSGNWILGDASGDTVKLPDATKTAPTYDTNYDDPTRFNAHPANIREVRITVVTRSEKLQGTKNRQAFPPLVVENHTPASTAADGYYRTSFTATVEVPNMTSRYPFIPPLKLGATNPELNSWGG